MDAARAFGDGDGRWEGRARASTAALFPARVIAHTIDVSDTKSDTMASRAMRRNARAGEGAAESTPLVASRFATREGRANTNAIRAFAVAVLVAVLCVMGIVQYGYTNNGVDDAYGARFASATLGDVPKSTTTTDAAALGDIISDLKDLTNKFKNFLTSATAPFNSAKSTFDQVVSQVGSLPNKVVGVKDKVGDMVDEVGDAVSGFVEDVYGTLFPTDAAKFVQKISGIVGATAELGGEEGPHFAERAGLGAIVRDLNQDVLREQLRARLYKDYVPQLGAHYEHAAKLGCSSLPKDTSEHEAAKLGCVAISSLTKVCYEAPMRDLLPEEAFSAEYQMPWPEKLGDSPFAPAQMSAGFPTAEWITCAGLEKFNIKTEVATELIKAFKLFFGALFDAITDGAKEFATDAKNAVMVPVNAIDQQVQVVGQHVNTAKDAITQATSVFGRRRLLSEEESHNLHSKVTSHAATLGMLTEHADFTYNHHMKRIEDQVLLQIEKIREILLQDPLLEDPRSLESFPHYQTNLDARRAKILAEHDEASLGAASDKLASARTALSNSMQALKNTEFEIAVTSNLEVSLEVDVSVSAFTQGDFMDMIMSKMKSPIDNPYIMSKTSMIGYGFYVNYAFGIGFKLPYFAKAEGAIHLGYTLSVPDMKVGIAANNGQFQVLFNPPVPVLTRDGETASISAHLQIGAELEIPIVQLELCWAGAICAGPKMYFAQGAQIGLDAFAAAMGAAPSDCFKGETTLQTGFSDFDYPNKPASCTLSGSGYAAGIGAYYQVPKPDASVVLTTKISQPCTVDVPDLVLYKSSSDDGFFAQAALFTPVCASNIQSGSPPPPESCE